MATKDERSDYLIQWRQGLWIQIRQKEDAIWRFITFFATAIVLVAGLVTGAGESAGVPAPKIPLIGELLILLAVVIVTLWGVLIVLDANFWLARNLLFVGNIERELLPPTDIGVLIPKAYTEPTFHYSRSYTIHIHMFYFTLSLILMAFAGLTVNGQKLSNLGELVIVGTTVLTFCTGLWYVANNDDTALTEYFSVRQQAPGNNLSPRRFPDAWDVTRLRWRSPVFAWQWLLGFFACAVFVFLSFSNQPYFNFEHWLRNILALLIAAIGPAGLLVIRRANRTWLPHCQANLSGMQDVQRMENAECIVRLGNRFFTLRRILGITLFSVSVIWLGIIVDAAIRYLAAI